ncbi:MAG: methionine--tRNA ligase [archaeon]
MAADDAGQVKVPDPKGRNDGKAGKGTEDRMLITSALPYANGSIHIGHLVEYIQTDIFVRFLKLKGKKAIYCCADDTHGTPIEINSSKLGIKPEELIAKYHKEHQEDFSSYHVSFDSYYSTNSKENKHFSDLIFNRLKEKGHIYTKEIESLYDPKAKRFLPDRYVKGECPKCGAKDQYGDVCEKCNATYKPTDLVNPYSTVTKERPELKSSVHYFFRLSTFSDKLDEWLLTNKNLQPEVVNYVRNWIKDGLEDWDISRDGPYFGFKIPGEEDKYYYVWLDAPIGYISSAQHYCDTHDEKLEDYWKPGQVIHFIGKDIVYFHLLFWPAVLMGADFSLPESVVVHGFLTVNGEKMSKSRGTFLTAREFLDHADPEFLRYYYASNLTHTMGDVDLDFEDFLSKVNNELISNIANLFYRSLSFLCKHFDGKVGMDVDQEVLESVTAQLAVVTEKLEAVEFREATKALLAAASIGNKYFQDNQPWLLIKEDKDAAHKVLSTCFSIVAWINTALKPILPVFTEKIEIQLGVPAQTWDSIGKPITDHQAGDAKIVLSKIDKISLDDGSKKKGTEAASLNALVKGDSVDFSAIDLRVAEVLEAKPHPNAERLLVLRIKVGDETRQLVAGLRQHYEPEDLLGKHIVIVTNLKPANLRGEKSQGMLLAVEKEGTVALVLAADADSGVRVMLDDGNQGKPVKAHPSVSPQITIDRFLAAGLSAKDGTVWQAGKKLSVSGRPLTIDKGVDSGTVR